MKQRFDIALTVLLSLTLAFFVMSCANTDTTEPEEDYSEFDKVEANADSAFNETYGDDDIELDPIEDDPIEDDVKDLENEIPKDTTKKDEPKIDNSVGLDRYQKYWSNGYDPDYPSSRYLIGVGAKNYDSENDKGHAKRQATADARAEIAAFFKAKIESKVKTEQEKITTIKAKVKHVGLLIKDEYNMTQSVKQSVKGAEVKGSTSDTKLKIIYVLVVLDRKRAAEIINEQLKSMKTTIEGNVSVYQTAASEGRLIKATNILAKTINMLIQFRAKRQEAIFIAPEGFVIIDLEGIEEGDLIQRLAEITIDLTLMVKSKITTTDENGNTKVQKLDSVTSQISSELQKRSSNLIMLKSASKFLKQTTFEEVSTWGVEDLKKAAPETNIIILASLEAVIVEKTEVAGKTVYVAKTNFTVQMIDIDSGDIVHSIDSGKHSYFEKTKGMLKNPKSALNASIGKAAEFIAKEIFNYISPS